MAEAPDGVRLDIAGPVATVTLCRPEKLNAQTPTMWSALRDVGRELPGDIRIVVVRGEGRAFSAGLDLSVVQGDDGMLAALAHASETESLQRIDSFQQAFSWLSRPDLLSVAAVRGYAIGAGFQLALACDMRILSDDAQLTMAEVTLGLVPDLGGTRRLVQLVGYSRALEICVTGRRVSAAEASELGLANVVVPAQELDAATDDLVAALLAAPRDAAVEIKALLAAASGRSQSEQEEAEREAQLRRIRALHGLE